MDSYQVESTQPSILVVDDTPNNLRLFTTLLRQHGYEVRAATNGRMAIAVANAVQIDLILLDIGMPDIDGYEVCHQLKVNEKTQSIPIIFVSVLDEALDKVRAFEVGGIDYITKPFHLEEVLVRVRTHINLRYFQRRLQQQNAELSQAKVQILSALESFDGLPAQIAERFQNGEYPIADRFDEATVLSANLVNLTSLVTQLPAIDLVHLLNQIFAAFDRLAKHYGLKAISCFGDTYLVASGVPKARFDHAEAIADMAVAMQQVLTEETSAEGVFHLLSTIGLSLQLRIGISSGPVVAGVIRNPFSYSVWGNTVNIAKQIEAQGTTGQIEVTEATYNLLKHRYMFEKRGEIFIEKVGRVTTYWLTGKVP